MPPLVEYHCKQKLSSLHTYLSTKSSKIVTDNDHDKYIQSDWCPQQLQLTRLGCQRQQILLEFWHLYTCGSLQRSSRIMIKYAQESLLREYNSVVSSCEKVLWHGEQTRDHNLRSTIKWNIMHLYPLYGKSYCIAMLSQC